MAKTYTYKEFQREFFPNLLLDRLEEKICSELRIEKDDFILSKDKENPKIGNLSFNKPSSCFIKSSFCLETTTDILGVVSRFYRAEGYKVKQGDSRIEAKKGKENYWIMVYEHERSYGLWINKASNSLYNFGRSLAQESLCDKASHNLKKTA